MSQTTLSNPAVSGSIIGLFKFNISHSFSPLALALLLACICHCRLEIAEVAGSKSTERLGQWLENSAVMLLQSQLKWSVDKESDCTFA